VILVPYPPTGFPDRIEGREAIVSGFRTLMGNFESFQAELTGVYPAGDADVVCVEYSNRAVLVGGTVYTNDNIAVFEFRRGLIAVYHDYFDPRRFQVVVDALPG
jgi:ketosteroid isomerase-like protein